MNETRTETFEITRSFTDEHCDRCGKYLYTWTDAHFGKHTDREQLPHTDLNVSVKMFDEKGVLQKEGRWNSHTLCADCCRSKTSGTFCGYSGLDCDIHGATESLPLGYADTCSDFKSWEEFYHERRLKGCMNML